MVPPGLCSLEITFTGKLVLQRLFSGYEERHGGYDGRWAEGQEEMMDAEE